MKIKAQSRSEGREYHPRGPKTYRRVLSLPAGAHGGKQVYVSGVQGSDRRSQFRGLLPLSALLQIFEGLRGERRAVKTIGRRGHDAVRRLRRV